MGDVRHVGEYLEIERPRRLVFTSSACRSLDSRMTTVTIEIRADGDGCELTLTHDGVPPDNAEGSRDGWGRILAGLLPGYHGVHGGGWR